MIYNKKVLYRVHNIYFRERYDNKQYRVHNIYFRERYDNKQI